LPDFRKQMNLPEWMGSLECLVEGSKQGRKRLAVMQKNLAAIATTRAKQISSTTAAAKAPGRTAGPSRRTSR
jgi:hypothetical protein